MIWTLLLTFTSLKLALNLVIFSIVFFQLHHQITAQEMTFLMHVSQRSKVLAFLNPTSTYSLCRLPCIFTEKFECKFFSTQAFFAPFCMCFRTFVHNFSIFRVSYFSNFSVKTHINLGLFGFVEFIKV